MMEFSEEERAYVRLNVLLAEDALRKLDVLKKRAGLASRGRTIQELIDIVWEMQADAKLILRYAESDDPNFNDARYFSKILPYLVNVLRRLLRFQG